MHSLTGVSKSLSSLVPALLPAAIICLVIWAMAKWGHSQMWALIVALLMGMFFGPDIHTALSAISSSLH